MYLDPTAFGVTSVMLSTVSGGLLLFSWLQNRAVGALVWWGISFWFCAGGIGLLGTKGTPATPAYLLSGNALLALAFGCQYVGCRIFNERPGRVLSAFAGLSLWVGFWPIIEGWFEARVAVMALIGTGYCWLMVWELRRKAPYRLLSQTALVAVLSCGGTYFLLRLVLTALPTLGPLTDLFASRWSSGMALLLLLYVPSLAFLFLSMAKEKGEHEYRQEALVDPLTRIPNRRAFTAEAERFLEQHRSRAVSCLVFDLDDFKAINDNYGHEAGDEVLRALAETLAATLSGSPFGRLGGDEFAAVLMGSEEARRKAEAIRLRFGTILARAEGGLIRATVSIGCTTASGLSLPDLLAQADGALYRAKAGGRDRVSGPEGDNSTLIRFPVRRAHRTKL